MLGAESMMYQPLVDFFRDRGMLVLREVTTTEGRIDVVAAAVDWEAARERVALGLQAALLRAPLLRAWEALPAEDSLDIDQWAHAMTISRSSAQSLARELVEARFVTRTPGGHARRVRLPMVVTEITCCEAKLVDWRRGLGQAYGHRFYADKTYLAIANRVPHGIDYALMAQRQVGLLHVTDTVETMLPAPMCEHLPRSLIMRRLLEERFWILLSSHSQATLTRAVPCATA